MRYFFLHTVTTHAFNKHDFFLGKNDIKTKNPNSVEPFKSIYVKQGDLYFQALNIFFILVVLTDTENGFFTLVIFKVFFENCF